MTTEIRPVTKKNVNTAIEVAVDISGEHYRTSIEMEFRASVGSKPDMKAVKRDLHISKSKYFLLYEDGEPAGMAGHYRIKGHPKDAWLGWMGVYDKFHGRGLGKLLVSEAFHRAAEKSPIKVERIWTTPEPEYDAARGLYKGLGFTPESYKPKAKDAARLIDVFSRRANPDAPAVDINDPESWQNSGYAIDCDKYTVPDLNRELGFKPKK